MPVSTTEGLTGRPEGITTISQVLANNIRAYRQLRRKEQQEVASRMNSLGHFWLRNTVSEVERAHRNVTVPELLALALVLGASVEQLLDSCGPGGRTGPEVALSVRVVRVGGEPLNQWWPIAPQEVGILLCSQNASFDAHWEDDDTGSSLRELVFMPGSADVDGTRS